MSLPTSNSLVLPESVPNLQQPLPRPQPDCHAVSQPIPRNAHPDNLLASRSLDNADPLTIFASRVPQGPVQNVVPSSHPFLTNDQPSLNFVWPTTLPPPPPDGPYQNLSANQATQAACTCPLCATDTTPIVQPPRFAGAQPARAGQDLLTAPPVAVWPSSSGMDPAAASLPAPPVPNAPVRYADAVNHGAGLFGLGQPTADGGGYARANERGGPSVWAPRRGREVPFVRVEDRIEWVSRDLLKMTLWFDWSSDVEARAREHEPC